MQRVGAAISNLFPARRAASRDDVLESLQRAEEDGIVASDSYDMIQRILYVSDMRVRDVMIPRSSIALTLLLYQVSLSCCSERLL